jgi:5-methylcytosine-specific restriction protein B
MTNKTDEQFEVRGEEAHAIGQPVKGGFLVREGATARNMVVPSAASYVDRRRTQLLADGVLIEEDGRLRFTKDYVFTSPSAAAATVLGRGVNGWTAWKHSDGRTLSEVKRIARSPGELMLSETKHQAITDKHRELLNDGRLYSEAAAQKYHDVFRDRFGPDVLNGLDGEPLLEFMHGQGKDSLAYWLEFKNDDELDTKRFGSIAGGSALKFRVFRRKETGAWQAGNKTNLPIDITVEEAVEYARAHRDQLLKGVQLLEQLPKDASDDDYGELQDQMDEEAPDVSRLAWGHKYFSLLFPDKLDDYHSADYQRFHILKLLQLPPEGAGRYICAGRFVSAAKEVGLSINTLTTILNDLHGKLHRYWRVGTRGGTSKISHWPMMQQRGCIAVGWADLGDISWVESKKESRDQLKLLIHEKYPNTASAEGRAATEVTNFISKMDEGDIVWAADGAKILGIARVTGGYRFEQEFDFPHQRSVEWLSIGECKMPFDEGLQSTVREVKKHNENIFETERRVQNKQRIIDPPDPKLPVLLQGIPKRIQSVLERKGQVILYGPPGTGKTYWATRAANDLAAISTFNRRFDELNEKQQRVITGDGQSSGVVRLCCFHPAYGYEDFLEGYRPQTIAGNISFELRAGIFKQLCHDAATRPDENFYLVVDEINRGDIPRIFGELLTILEKDKRNKPIVLPVSQEYFTIPPNVFLIGTMNTADRSISLLDAALRRRFGFIEMMPDGTVLRDSVVAGVPLRGWFEALNTRIREHVGRDARNLQIGHSYLMQGGSPLKDVASLKRAIRDDIIPLLEEYCYEDYGTLGQILGEELVDVPGQRICHELFDDNQDSDLIQALLAPCPEISSSTEALSSDESPDEPEDDEDEES